MRRRRYKRPPVRTRVLCPLCLGHGGAQVTRFWGRGPNECYPDWEECGECQEEGTVTVARAREVRREIEAENRMWDEMAREEERAELERIAREEEAMTYG